MAPIHHANSRRGTAQADRGRATAGDGAGARGDTHPEGMAKADAQALPGRGLPLERPCHTCSDAGAPPRPITTTCLPSSHWAQHRLTEMPRGKARTPAATVGDGASSWPRASRTATTCSGRVKVALIPTRQGNTWKHNIGWSSSTGEQLCARTSRLVFADRGSSPVNTGTVRTVSTAVSPAGRSY